MLFVDSPSIELELELVPALVLVPAAALVPAVVPELEPAAVLVLAHAASVHSVHVLAPAAVVHVLALGPEREPVLGPEHVPALEPAVEKPLDCLACACSQAEPAFFSAEPPNSASVAFE